MKVLVVRDIKVLSVDLDLGSHWCYIHTEEWLMSDTVGPQEGAIESQRSEELSFETGGPCPHWGGSKSCVHDVQECISIYCCLEKRRRKAVQVWTLSFENYILISTISSILTVLSDTDGFIYFQLDVECLYCFFFQRWEKKREGEMRKWNYRWRTKPNKKCSTICLWYKCLIHRWRILQLWPPFPPVHRRGEERRWRTSVTPMENEKIILFKKRRRCNWSKSIWWINNLFIWFLNSNSWLVFHGSFRLRRE